MIFRFVFILICVFFSFQAFAQELPNNFHDHRGLMKGAVPGFSKGKIKFDPVSAKQQILSLYNNKNVRVIVSLDHCKDVQGVIKNIKSENKDFLLEHECRKIRRGKNYFMRNVTLFREISSMIGNVNVFVHCRYGAHRAVTAITGAWVSKEGLSFKEAFRRSGGKLRSFRSKGQTELLGQAKKYARTSHLWECLSD